MSIVLVVCNSVDFVNFFAYPDDGFPEKPKHVTRIKYQKHSCASLLQNNVEFLRNTATSPATDKIRQIPTLLFSFERFHYFFVSLLLAFWPVTNLSELAGGAGRDISFVSSVNPQSHSLCQ